MGKLDNISASSLRARLEEKRDNQVEMSENHGIRLWRAVSWLRCSEEYADNLDLKFISLWISFNSCYAYSEAIENEKSEREQFNDFIKKLVSYDHENRFYNIIWKYFPGPVRILINNQFAYKPFWDFQNGKRMKWEDAFENSKYKAQLDLQDEKVSSLLGIIFDRLYVVRNQLLHGGATYKSKVNRPQVQDAGNILSFLMPTIIDIMITNKDDDWGTINYPVVK